MSRSSRWIMPGRWSSSPPRRPRLAQRGDQRGPHHSGRRMRDTPAGLSATITWSSTSASGISSPAPASGPAGRPRRRPRARSLAAARRSALCARSPSTRTPPRSISRSAAAREGSPACSARSGRGGPRLRVLCDSSRLTGSRRPVRPDRRAPARRSAADARDDEAVGQIEVREHAHVDEIGHEVVVPGTGSRRCRRAAAR